jgi:hypothetical protein
VVLCVDDVLQVERPPWARQEGSETTVFCGDGGEEQLALYREQLHLRESIEWDRIRDAFYRTAALQGVTHQRAGTT